MGLTEKKLNNLKIGYFYNNAHKMFADKNDGHSDNKIGDLGAHLSMVRVLMCRNCYVIYIMGFKEKKLVNLKIGYFYNAHFFADNNDGHSDNKIDDVGAHSW